jgi:LacI family transcriptional regulator
MPNHTLEDIAKLAGVSRSTVSRVVNNQPNVSKVVRERVLGVIKKTNYQPNAAARMLASQRSWMIGLVLPHSVSRFFTDPYFPRLMEGIARGCNENEYTLAFFLAGSEEDEAKIFPRVSRSGMLDGVIVQAGHDGDLMVGRLIDAEIPVVVAGRPFHSEYVSYIDIDNIDASYKAVCHLFQLGHKRIGTIAGPARSTVGLDRKEGYLKAYREFDMLVDESLIKTGDFTEEGGYLAMKKMIPAKPDAVFAASDIMAIGAMCAVSEAGLSIPADIALVGFDDLPLAARTNFQLTTVRQPVQELGIKAVELLIDVIENGINPPRKVILNTELIIRGSCGAP